MVAGGTGPFVAARNGTVIGEFACVDNFHLLRSRILGQDGTRTEKNQDLRGRSSKGLAASLEWDDCKGVAEPSGTLWLRSAERR